LEETKSRQIQGGFQFFLITKFVSKFGGGILCRKLADLWGERILLRAIFCFLTDKDGRR
jgi:hypothetical protein